MKHRKMDVQAEPHRVIRKTRLGMQLTKFPSQKMGRTLILESSIETDAALTFEFDPWITTYCEQPLELVIETGGKKSLYVPDFLTVDRDFNQKLWEVKPSYWNLSPYWVDRLNSARTAAQESGYGYEVLTDSDLRNSEWLKNLRVLYPRLGSVQTSDFLYAQEKLTSAKGTVRVRDLINLGVGFNAAAMLALRNCTAALRKFPLNLEFVLREG